MEVEVPLAEEVQVAVGKNILAEVKSPGILIACMLLASMLTVSAQNSRQLKLVFTGDIMGHDTQIESALAMGQGTYDYSSCFRYIEPYLSSADIAIGNLEVTLAGPPYKGYPAFSSPDELAGELKKSGFDILVNANNHAIDRRQKGLERTIRVLDSIGILQTGVFKDAEARARSYPLIVEKNSIRLALLNYTYGTNGINVTKPNIVNYIDTIQMKKDLEKARSAEPDFTIVLMHWGQEYERSENSSQREMAEFLFKHGANAIIGSHPHVVQPIRDYGQGRLVVFSMGNMISNQRKRYTNGGILVDLTLEKTDSTRITDTNYYPVYVHKPILEKGTAFSLVPAAIDSAYFGQLRITGNDAAEMKEFLMDTRENLKGAREADWKLFWSNEF